MGFDAKGERRGSRVNRVSDLVLGMVWHQFPVVYLKIGHAASCSYNAGGFRQIQISLSVCLIAGNPWESNCFVAARSCKVLMPHDFAFSSDVSGCKLRTRLFSFITNFRANEADAPQHLRTAGR